MARPPPWKNKFAENDAATPNQSGRRRMRLANTLANLVPADSLDYSCINTL